jgi:hypothetical protein
MTLTQTKFAIVALASIISVQAFAAPPTPLGTDQPNDIHDHDHTTSSKINSTPLVWIDATGKVVGRAFGLDVLVYTYKGKLTMFQLASTGRGHDYDSRYGVPSTYYDVFFQDSNCTGAPFIPIIQTADAIHNAFGTRLSAVVNDTVYISTSDTPSSIISFNSFLEAGGCIVHSSEHYSYPATPVPLSTLMTLPLQLR